MTLLTPEQAFTAYEAVRHRLPTAVPRPHKCQHVGSLSDIADQFDVFLLDAFGVLNIGEKAIPGTAERVEQLREAGKRVLVVSNAAAAPPTALQAKYRRLGYEFALEDIITSRTTMSAAVRTMDDTHWGVMCEANADLSDLGLPHITVLGDTPDAYAQVEGFLLVGSAKWSEEQQALLVDALNTEPRPVLVANPDIVAPRETGFSAEPGHFAHRLADQTGIEPRFFGKPFTNIFDQAFARVGPVDKSRVLMVGDSLHTDILGGIASGVRSALVADYGFFADLDVTQAIKAAGIEPDFVISRP